MNNKISVIVPIYNVVDYLDRCIQSITNQTYKDLEIILVDDGSYDNSSELCDRWAKQDKRIKVIHKKNGGLSDARNVGIDIATGDYIAFVDSDDFIDYRMYEILLNNLKSTNSDISVCGSIDFTDEKKIVADTFEEKITVISYQERFDTLYNNLLPQTVVAWNKLYKKEIFYNLRYPVDKIHEDVFLIHHILDKAKKIVYSNKKLYYYFTRTNSISNSISIKKINELEGMKDRVNFFKLNYPATKYVNLSIMAYCDKLIRIYCQFMSCNKNHKFDDVLAKMIIEYNKVYNQLKQIKKHGYKNVKYTIFKKCPYVIYILKERI